MCFNHQHNVRTRADGTSVDYEYETYRCYRKISSKGSCGGQNVYKADVLNDAVEEQVRLFLSRIGSIPREHMVALASARNEEAFTVSYRQAEKEFENAQKQVAALEEQVVKALVGESQLDLSVVNSMLLKHRAKLEGAQQAMEEARTRMEAEKANARTATAQIDQLVSWAECYDRAEVETKHMIIARLIDRVEVGKGYKVHIRFKISIEQFLGKTEQTA